MAMRRFLRTVSIAMLCGLLCTPIVEGRGRNDHNNGGGQKPPTHQNAPQRPGNGNNNNSNRPNRPGNGNHNNGNRPNRPGNGNHNNGNRPNRPGNGNHNNGNRPNRPGNGNHNNGNRPNRPGYPANRPNRPGNMHNPGHNRPPHHNVHHGVPHRPMMPPPRPYVRPVPPPRFRPFRGPSLSTILGVALGTTLNYALDRLVYSGYNVTGYGSDAIYLSNVDQINMMWPNATMHYYNGMLSASEFVYSTPYYDLNRYNAAYNTLSSAYGLPANTVPYGNGGMLTSWWGNGGQ